MLSVQSTSTSKRKPDGNLSTNNASSSSGHAKRKRTKEGDQQQRRQQQQQVISCNTATTNISPQSNGSGNGGNGGDESAWILGLINNIEQLLTTFNAINGNSNSSASSSPTRAAVLSASGSSTPSSSCNSSSSAFSSTLSSPQSSPGAAASVAAAVAAAAAAGMNTLPVQHHHLASGAAAAAAASAQQTLPRSPMSRQIKFHEYKGPPSSKRQQHQQNQKQQAVQCKQQQQQQISTNNNNNNQTAQQVSNKTNKQQDVILVGEESAAAVKNLNKNTNHRVSAKTAGINQQQQAIVQSDAKDRMVSSDDNGVNLQHHHSPVNFNFSSSAAPATTELSPNGCYTINGPTAQSDPTTNLMPVQTQAHILHHPLQQQQQKEQRQLQHHLVRQVRLTSGPQCTNTATIQQTPASSPSSSSSSSSSSSYATTISPISQQHQQPISAASADSIGVFASSDETTAVLASPSIAEAIRQNHQQQQQQRQTTPTTTTPAAPAPIHVKIEPSESYHQQQQQQHLRHNHQQPHHLQPQQSQQQQQHHVQQLHLQPYCSSQLRTAPSTFMIHTMGHGSTNGSFVSHQLYLPIQKQQLQPAQSNTQAQQHSSSLKLQQSSPMNSLRSAGMVGAIAQASASATTTTTTTNACLGDGIAKLNRLQQQSIMTSQSHHHHQQQQQQLQQQPQLNISYRHDTATQEVLGFCNGVSGLQTANYNVDQLDSAHLMSDSKSFMLHGDDSLAVFGPDSEETLDDACDIEPSIGFSHGSDELLFSEFIDLQDVPMNVDESDWLKKFLPPCSMS